MNDEVVGIGIALILLALVVVRALRPSAERQRWANLMLNFVTVALLAAFLVIAALRFVQLAAVDPPPTPGPNPSRAELSPWRG